MDNHGQWLRESELIDGVASRGVRVTSRQIERWREAGLIPYQRQGLGRAGSVPAFYPPEAVDQVVHIATLLRKDRNLDRVAFALWIPGYPVDLTPVRRTLQEAVTHQRALIGRLFSDGQLTDAAWDRIDRSEKRRSRDPVLQQIRRAVSRYLIPTFTLTSFEFSGGNPPQPFGDESEPVKDSLYRGFAAVAPFQLPTDKVLPTLQGLAFACHPDALDVAVSTAPDEVLQRARDEVDPMLRTLLDTEWRQTPLRDIALLVVFVLSLMRLGGIKTG